MPTDADESTSAGGPRGNDVAGADAALRIEQPPDLRGVRRFSHEAMATVFEVHAVHPDERYAAQAAQAAFEVLNRLEQELSRFVANSDVTRINHLAAGQTARVGTPAIECLAIARHMFDLTGGAFDISLGSGLASLDVDPGSHVVRATSDGVRIDLGGIGKGYAIDRMADLLEEWGLGRALVHGGFSSVLALDPPDSAGAWPLTLSDPGRPSTVLVRLPARQMALGASGTRKGNHIVDPCTGESVVGRLAAWVAVPRPSASHDESGQRVAAAAVADALSTAFMTMAPEAIEALCDSSTGLEAWIVPEPGGDDGGATRLLHFGGPTD
jgi:FAD:protein FMN transferase